MPNMWTFGRTYRYTYLSKLYCYFSQLVDDRIVQNKTCASYYYTMQLINVAREEKQNPAGLKNT